MWTEEDTQSTQPLVNGQKTKRDNVTPPRSCNDILFTILFAACCVGMAVISGIAFKKGDPSLLVPSYANNHTVPFVASWFQNAVAQARLDSDILISSVALAVVLGFVWIFLMKVFTKLFIYLSLFAGVVAVIGLGGYFVSMGQKQGSDGFSIIGYVMFGLAAVLLLLVILLRKKIALTCAMFTETCRGVQHNLALFPLSFVVIAAFLGFAAYWVASFIYLYSIPGHSINPDEHGPPKFNESIRNLMFFMLFGFFWTSAFLSAVFQHTVAGAISTWYFSRDVMSPRPVGIPAVTSLFRALTTSFGSLAFGALLIAIVETLNTLLQYAKKTNPTNRFARFIMSCLQCVLGCIEGIVRYVNKFAYIRVAMRGHGFCQSAKECYDLISRNFFNTVIIDVISGFVLFMGKIFFTAISTIILIGAIDDLGRHLSAVTVGLTMAISFVVLHIISHIMGVGINTVFVCYLDDLEINKGKASDMYISPDLHQMLQDKAQEERSKTSRV